MKLPRAGASRAARPPPRGAAAAVILWLPRRGRGRPPAPPSRTSGRRRARSATPSRRAWPARTTTRDAGAGREDVLGDFADRHFTYEGVTSRFFRKDAVRRQDDGPRPARRLPRAYVFGVTPLQQYLLELPGAPAGPLDRLDSARSEGGQRWFHLYPGEKWTTATSCTGRSSAELEHQCASATHEPPQGYVLAETASTTHLLEVTWPASPPRPRSRHVSGAQARGRKLPPARTRASSSASASERRSGRSTPSGGREAADSVDARPEVEGLRPLPRAARPPHRGLPAGSVCSRTPTGRRSSTRALLRGRQMRDELQLGSFLQSKMYARVTCSDCHDAHAAKVRVVPDAVCSSCHAPSVAGASTTSTARAARGPRAWPATSGRDVHVVDPGTTTRSGSRAGLTRGPRPGERPERLQRLPPRPLGAVGSPASGVVPRRQQEKPHYATALHAGRTSGRAEPLLLEVIRDAKQRDREGHRRLAPPAPGPVAARLEQAARDPDPLVRLARPRPSSLPPKERVRIGFTCCGPRARRPVEPYRFADVPDAELETEQRAAFDRSLDDFRLAQRSVAERPGRTSTSHRPREAGAARAGAAGLRHGAASPWFPRPTSTSRPPRVQTRRPRARSAPPGIQVDRRTPRPPRAGAPPRPGQRPARRSPRLARAASSPRVPDFAYAYAIASIGGPSRRSASPCWRRRTKRSPRLSQPARGPRDINRRAREAARGARWARNWPNAPGDPARAACSPARSRRRRFAGPPR